MFFHNRHRFMNVVIGAMLVLGLSTFVISQRSEAGVLKGISLIPKPIISAISRITELVPEPVLKPVVRLTIPSAQNTQLAQQRFVRLSINEDSRALRNGGVPTSDNLGILQTALAFQEWKNKSRRNPLTVQDVIGTFAPCMAGLKPCKPTTKQRRWTRNLPMVGMDQPEGWLPRDGNWSLFAENWSKYRGNIAEVFAEGFEAPCKGKPIAWGCADDDHIAISRGLCKLECVETRNWFWGFPRDNTDVPCEIRTEPRVPAPSRKATILASKAF